VWFTLKDIGKTQVFNAKPPFQLLTTIDTGPITNHVNIVRNANGQFAYVTIGGLNTVKVFRTDTFVQVAAIAVGDLPHGIWPSGDGTRVYVGLENADKVVAIDTLQNKVIAEVPVGQGAQALTYVPGASVAGTAPNLQPLGLAGMAAHLSLAASGAHGYPPTSVGLFDQGLTQVLEASVTGLAPRKPYLLALSQKQDGSGPLRSLARFTTNPAGAAIVNALGPIRQVVEGSEANPRWYLVIAPDADGAQPVQVQVLK
jgi:YVTN family beta-propeller protein